MDYNKVWSLFNKHGLSQNAAARIVGMSSPGFATMMKRETMTISTLEKIAAYFKVPIQEFFEKTEYSISADRSTEVNESYIKLYNCENCIKKQREVDKLKDEMKETQKQLIEIQKEHIETIKSLNQLREKHGYG